MTGAEFGIYGAIGEVNLTTGFERLLTQACRHSRHSGTDNKGDVAHIRSSAYAEAMTFRNPLPEPTYTKDGAECFPSAASAVLNDIWNALADLPTDQAGVRIHGIESLRPALAPAGPVGALAARFLGGDCRPVRAILFDKSEQTNWSLGWHQDRTICVKRRIDVEGFGPWTLKSGLSHVAPPFELLARMVTLRLHLDDVPAENAPLLIAPGSHAAGRVAVDAYAEVVRKFGIYSCLAMAGDVWLYATPILHASEASSAPGHRRVLQVDYSADTLPGGLEWLGV